MQFKNKIFIKKYRQRARQINIQNMPIFIMLVFKNIGISCFAEEMSKSLTTGGEGSVMSP